MNDPIKLDSNANNNNYEIKKDNEINTSQKKETEYEKLQRFMEAINQEKVLLKIEEIHL